MQTQQTKLGAVRIGRSGTKLHPASVDPRYGLIIHCRCGGTQNGSAHKNARFFEGATANCRI